MVPISTSQWPSCAQQASLFMHGHGRAAFPFLLLILLSVIPANSGPPMPDFSRYKRPSILIPAQDSRRDQKILEEGGGAGPSNLPRRDHEQGGGAGLSKLDIFCFELSKLFVNSSATDIVLVTLSSTAVETAIAQCTSRWAMARGHRRNTSIVLAAVHGLSGLFRAVSAVESSLCRPLPTLSPSLIGHLASVDVKQHESKSPHLRAGLA